MKILWFIASLPLFLSSCASFLSGFSVGSMVSGQAANVMPRERKAIIDEAKKEMRDELEHKGCRHLRKVIF